MAKKEYKKSADDSRSIYDRVPPQAGDVEEAVLAGMMNDEMAAEFALGELNEGSFYHPKNAVIFNAMRTLYSRRIAIDMITVVNLLKEEGSLESIGGYKTLGDIITNSSSVSHLEYYVSILKQKAIQRDLIKASFEIQKMAYNESVDVDDLMLRSQSLVYDIIQQGVKKQAVNVRDAINDVIDDIQKTQKGEGPKGVPTGYESLDKISRGWQPGNLIVIGARPGIGKTALALNLAANAAIEGNTPVAFFSLEMTKEEIIKRLIEAQTGITGAKITGAEKMSGDDWQMLERGILGLSKADFYIDETPSLPTTEFKAKAKHLVDTKGVGIIFIDYLQIMTHPGAATRFDEVSQISHILKAMAKELGVPIVALAQLNRNLLQRAGGLGRPMLSDIKESGAIEQDADIVMFLHRPDALGLEEDPSMRGSAEVIVAKNRNGAITTIPMSYKESIVRFVEMNETLSFQAVQSRMNTTTVMDIGGKDAFASASGDFYNPNDEF